jgi:hypothetical protein
MSKIRIVYQDNAYPEHSRSIVIPYEEKDDVCYLKMSKEFLNDMIDRLKQNGMDIQIV